VSTALIQAIKNRLVAADYVEMPSPLKVAGVEFPFTAAMHGSKGRSLDLVLLVNTSTGEFGETEGARVRQRVEALSRALDVTQSRYVVTLILAGAALAEHVDTLAETCRVLHVEGIAVDANGQPQNSEALMQLEDRIRILLPLTLPAEDQENSDEGTPIEQLTKALPANLNGKLLDAAIEASNEDEEAVTQAIAKVIDEALSVPMENRV